MFNKGEYYPSVALYLEHFSRLFVVVFENTYLKVLKNTIFYKFARGGIIIWYYSHWRVSKPWRDITQLHFYSFFLIFISNP